MAKMTDGYWMRLERDARGDEMDKMMIEMYKMVDEMHEVIVKREVTDSFNAVLRALGKLYEVYYPKVGEKNRVEITDVLGELMQAYSDWLN